MPHVQLIHWNADEAVQLSRLLQAAGYEADSQVPNGPEFVRKLREDLPEAVVIDLSRLPTQGRDFGMMLRHSKSTRYIPLVFVGGDPVKVEKVREQIPDAVYTGWDEIGPALKQAIYHPPSEPVAPKSLFDSYAGRPLAQKLGLKAGMRLGLISAPPDFRQTLGEVPAGVQVDEQAGERCETLLWFVRTRGDLEQGIESLVSRQDFRFLWIAWPKKASGVETDLSQPLVREAGLAAGLVDFKICAIDAVWTGLQFTRRKKPR